VLGCWLGRSLNWGLAAELLRWIAKEGIHRVRVGVAFMRTIASGVLANRVLSKGLTLELVFLRRCAPLVKFSVLNRFETAWWGVRDPHTFSLTRLRYILSKAHLLMREDRADRRFDSQHIVVVSSDINNHQSEVVAWWFAIICQAFFEYDLRNLAQI